MFPPIQPKLLTTVARRGPVHVDLLVHCYQKGHSAYPRGICSFILRRTLGSQCSPALLSALFCSALVPFPCFQVDTSTRNPESVKQGYLFEVPVQKWSRTERAFKNRLLALTKSSVVEMDVATR